MRKVLAKLGAWLVARFDESPDLSQHTAAAPPREPNPVSQAEEATDPFGGTFRDAQLSGWFNQNTDELFTGFAISKDDCVLDVGCGDSPFLQFCAARGADIMFADIDEANVEATYSKLLDSNARSITPIVSDANPLPLDDAIASKIIAMEVIEHVDDPAIFLAELARVGKSGARYLITAPDATAEQLQAKGLAPDSYFEKPNHIRIIERAELVSLVEQAGLVVEQQHTYGFYWSLWWIFFWACKEELGTVPMHPVLASWTTTWEQMLNLEDGPRIKQILDGFMPKSQAIIALKP